MQSSKRQLTYNLQGAHHFRFICMDVQRAGGEWPLFALDYLYITWSYRLTTDTKTPYIQGYVAFRTVKDLADVQARLPGYDVEESFDSEYEMLVIHAGDFVTELWYDVAGHITRAEEVD